MFDTDLELDIEQELSEIPPEYQDAFRQALVRELAETEQNRTDTDILTYQSPSSPITGPPDIGAGPGSGPKKP